MFRCCCEIDKERCYTCKRRYQHRVGYKDCGNGMKEMFFHMDCAYCKRDKKDIERLTEKKKQIERDICDIEFNIFSRKMVHN